MNKTFLHTHKLTKQLGTWKEEQEMLRWKRAELMTRLREADFSFDEIAKIYGCKRQYVEQIVSKHQLTGRTEAEKVTA